jgi:ribonuclease P protein component
LDGTSTFPKRERLRYGHQFRRVYERGRRAAGRYVAVHVLEEPPHAAAETRPRDRAVGVVSGRRIGPANARNRARRLLREAYRRNKHKLKTNIQIVIVARTAMRDARLSDVERELLRLLRVAGAMSGL